MLVAVLVAGPVGAMVPDSHRAAIPAPVASAPADGAQWPVSGTLVRGFIAPRCEKCRGPRGVEFAVTEGSVVRAAVTGEVSFVGQVSRRLFVVQRLANGVLLTYGWLAGTTPGLGRGRTVSRGDELGRTGTRFYLGARIRGRYVDPLVVLGLGRLRLVGPGTIGPPERSR